MARLPELSVHEKFVDFLWQGEQIFLVRIRIVPTSSFVCQNIWAAKNRKHVLFLFFKYCLKYTSLENPSQFRRNVFGSVLCLRLRWYKEMN